MATTQPARELLIALVKAADSGKYLRPIGDCRLGYELQSSGLATMDHVDDKTIRITPTHKGRGWVALITNPAMSRGASQWRGQVRTVKHHG